MSFVMAKLALMVMLSAIGQSQATEPNVAADAAADCGPLDHIRGSWVTIGSSSAALSVTVPVGVTHSYTGGSDSAFSKDVASGVSEGFSFVGSSAGAGVAGGLSNTFANQFSSTFSMTSSTTRSFHFNAGTVWQWQFTVTDRCGDSTIRTNSMAVTTGAWMEPCCLPGYSANDEMPHGPCHSGPNVCLHKPKPTPAADCGPLDHIRGSWVTIGESAGSAGDSITLPVGVTHSYTGGSHSAFSKDVASGVSEGFSFVGRSAGAGVAGGLSNTFANQFSDTFSMTSTKPETFHFNAGILWQWRFTVTDRCGDSTIKTADIALTTGYSMEPCCLPGYFANPEMPHGPCHSGPNVCLHKPKPTPAADCGPLDHIKGSWVMITSSSAAQTVTVPIEIIHSYPGGSESAFSKHVASGVSEGFSFVGSSAGAGVAGGLSNTIANQFSSTFSMTSSTTRSFNFNAGTVWQWRFTVTDRCGTSTIKTADLVLTRGISMEPCCLPGYFANSAMPHGPCIYSGPNVCNTVV